MSDSKKELGTYEVNYYGDLKPIQKNNTFDVKVITPCGNLETNIYVLNDKDKIRIQTIFYDKFLIYDFNKPFKVSMLRDEKIVVKKQPIELDTTQLHCTDFSEKEQLEEILMDPYELDTKFSTNKEQLNHNYKKKITYQYQNPNETDEEFLDRISNNNNFNARH